MKPEPHEYPPFMSRYVDLVADETPLATLKSKPVGQLLQSLTETASQYRYAEGKWSIRELLGHLVDTERIFAYRALCMARGERQPLPGFDEDAYVENAGFERRTLQSLLAEYAAVREATVLLFGSFDEAALAQTGISNGNPVSVRALLHITAGHELHHAGILRERYLAGSQAVG